MELRSENASFLLTILGYQFPDAEGEPYDANWLRVRVDAAGEQGAWSVVDPCLLTDEVAALADWLSALAAGRQAAPALSFLEPALLFRRARSVDGMDALHVHFGALFPHALGTDRHLEFPLAGLDLSAAAQALRDALRRYPERREG